MHGSSFACGCCEHHPRRMTTTFSREPLNPVRSSGIVPPYTKSRSAHGCAQVANAARTPAITGAAAPPGSQEGAVFGTAGSTAGFTK